jgi:hypothetical protein
VDERTWRKLYQAALSEDDPVKLQDRIRETEEAIVLRAQTLAQTVESSPDFWGESTDLRDASATLLRLQREILEFPGWEPHH